MSFPRTRHCIKVIKEGNIDQNKDQLKASAPVVLVQGVHNVLVGTGLPGDKDCLLKGLEEHGVSPDEVEYVVCSHGAIEECGNLNLFPRATHIIGYNIIRGDTRILHDFAEDIPYEIDDEIEVLPTPGFREGGVVSMVISSTPIGRVAIAGGVFHSEGDLEDPDLWVNESCHAEDQQQSRINLLKIADYVVPRYGPLFQIPDSYRGSGMPVIQTP